MADDTLAQAVITGVSPGGIVQGDSVVVTINGNKTNFSGASVVSCSNTGVTASSLAVTSATAMSATLAADLAATVGPSDITVTTGSQVATGADMLTVEQAPPATIFVSPDKAMRGTVATVQITGFKSHFDDTSVVSFAGQGITVSAVTVFSPTMLRATITIDPNAEMVTSPVEVVTGPEVATEGVFTIELNPALVKITGVNPGTAEQGSTDLAVEITGQHTNFDETSVVSFAGAGIILKAFSLTSATVMSATLDIDPSASTGTSNVTVTTGTEVATGVGVFTVIGSAQKAEVLREAVNTYLRQNHITDPLAVQICEDFIGNVNQAMRGQAAGEGSGVLITVGVRP